VFSIKVTNNIIIVLLKTFDSSNNLNPFFIFSLKIWLPSTFLVNGISSSVITDAAECVHQVELLRFHHIPKPLKSLHLLDRSMQKVRRYGVPAILQRSSVLSLTVWILALLVVKLTRF